jgi:hypothetical protein
MKCILCMHYDVVNFECKHLADKFGLDEHIQSDPTWGCNDYSSATAKNVIDKFAESDKLKIDITVSL